MKVLPPVEIAQDNLGELLSNSDLDSTNFSEINFTITHAQQTRGDRYHKDHHELFVIIAGEVEVTTCNIFDKKPTKFIAKKGDRFIIQPFELYSLHAMTDCQWLNLVFQTATDNTPCNNKKTESQIIRHYGFNNPRKLRLVAV